MAIQDLDPDYVLAVNYSADGAESSAEGKNLKFLLDTLTKKGFQTQARPGADPKTSVLIFAKLASKKYIQLVETDLVQAFEFGVTASDNTSADRTRLVHSYLTDSEAFGGVGITPGKGDWLFVTAIVPVSGFLTDKNAVAKAKKELCAPALDTLTVKNDFGVQVALYFEFLKFYIGSLGVLSVFGLVAFFRSKNYSLTYSFVNLIWGVVFFLFWKRRERYLVNFWGVQNVHKYNADRALASEKTSSLKSKDSAEGKRFIKQVAFAPVALLFVGVLVSYQLTCFVLEIFLSEIYDGPGKAFLTLLPTILLSVFVPILTIVYNIVVDKFLAWEGHESDSTRTESSLVKTFVLNFLTGYVPLLITSFIYLPFAHLIEPNLGDIQNTIAANINSDRYLYKYLTKVKSQQEFKINQERLNAQFYFFMVTNQVVGLVLKYGLPLVLGPVIAFVKAQLKGKVEETKIEEDPEEVSFLLAVRKTVLLPEYNVNDDFRGFTLQYGYLIIFGPVWTVAPLLCLVFNVIFYKLDKLKLANGQYFRPPIPKRVDSVHPWDYALLILTWIGSVVSPIVTAFYRHGTKPPKPLGQFAFDKASVNVSSSTLLIIVLFASEHLFFVFFILGSKISAYLKTDKEIENDFANSDINLRKAEFNSKAISSIVAPTEDWKETSVESILKQAKGVEVPSEIKASAISSAINSAPTPGSAVTSRSGKDSLIAQKQREYEAKQAELRTTLEAHKDKDDTIVNTVDTAGKASLAIIDGNAHISEEDQNEISQILKLAKEASPSEVESVEPNLTADEDVGETTPSTSSQSDVKKASKKKSLKKLLKRK